MMTDGTLNFCGDIACYAVYRILSMWNINTVTSFKKKQETKDGSRQFSLLKVFETENKNWDISMIRQNALYRFIK